MDSTTRTLCAISERARSLARLVMRLARMPAAGCTSNSVTTGPGDTATTVAPTPNSCSFSSRRLAWSRNTLSDCNEVSGGGSDSRLSDGRSPPVAGLTGMSGSIFLGCLGAAAAAARRLRTGRAIFALPRPRVGDRSRRPTSENSAARPEYTPSHSQPRPSSVKRPVACVRPTQERPVTSVMPVIHSASRTTQAPMSPSTGARMSSSQTPMSPPPSPPRADISSRPHPQTTTSTRPAARTPASGQDQSSRALDGARYQALKPITAAGNR